MDLTDIQNLLLKGTPEITIAVIYFLMMAVRAESCRIPNWIIPIIAPLMGTLIYPGLEKNWSLQNLCFGFVYGGLSTWFNEAITQVLDRLKGSKPPVPPEPPKPT